MRESLSRLDVPAADRALMLGGNAARLLGLQGTTAQPM